MSKTKNQLKGEYGENEAKFKYVANDCLVSNEKSNNKGFDFKAENIFTGEETVVESKTNSSRLTKAQKDYKKDVESKGGTYNVEHTSTYDLFD